MIGLGVGIDYALFIVSRYREGLHAGRSPREATDHRHGHRRTGRGLRRHHRDDLDARPAPGRHRMGRRHGHRRRPPPCSPRCSPPRRSCPRCSGFARERVELTRWRGLIAAGFAAVALLGVGIGVAPLAAVGAGLAALTLLASLAVRAAARPVPRRVAKPVRATSPTAGVAPSSAAPGAGSSAATVVLLILAAPVVGLRLGWADEGNFPEDTYTRQAYDLLAEGFGPGFNGPFIITVVPGRATASPRCDALQRGRSTTPPVSPPSPPPIPDDPAAPEAYLMSLVADDRTPGRGHHRTGHRLRDDVIPAAIGRHRPRRAGHRRRRRQHRHHRLPRQANADLLRRRAGVCRSCS